MTASPSIDKAKRTRSSKTAYRQKPNLFNTELYRTQALNCAMGQLVTPMVYRKGYVEMTEYIKLEEGGRVASEIWNALPKEQRSRLHGFIMHRQLLDYQIERKRAIEAHKAHLASIDAHIKTMKDSLERWRMEIAPTSVPQEGE